MVSQADLCGGLYAYSVARILPQVGQDDIRHVCGLVQTVCGIPVFYVVVQDDAICEKRG